MQEQHGPRLFTPQTVILYHHELTYKGQNTSKQVKKQICILSSTMNSITSPLKLLFETAIYAKKPYFSILRHQIRKCYLLNSLNFFEMG